MPTDTLKRPASSPLCKGKLTKFTRVDDQAQIEKTVAKRLVNNEIDKIKRVGLATLTDFCELHEMETKGSSVIDIIKSMVQEGILNDDMEMVMEGMGNTLLNEELLRYQKAKIEALIDVPMAVLAIVDGDDTVISDSNIKEVIEKGRTVAKDTRVAVTTDLKRNEERTKELERVQIRSQLKEEKLSLIITKINMGDSKETVSFKLAEEARVKLIEAAKSCYKDDYNAKLDKPEDITMNKYLKIHGIITDATIVAMGREAKPDKDTGIKTIPIIMTVSTEHQKEAVRTMAKDAKLSVKNTMPRMFLKQKTEVDTLIKTLPEMKGMWVKTDIILGREEHSPMFRVQWKAPPTPSPTPQKWVTKTLVTIRNPEVWGRLLQEDKERVIMEEMRTTAQN